LEFESSKENSSSDEEVFLLVVGLGNWVLVLLALHELATNAAAVLVAHLIHLDGVVTAVERDDEGSALIIGLGGDELSVESQDVHVLFEHLLHVELGLLWLQRDDAAHGVLFSSVAHVRWRWLVLN